MVRTCHGAEFFARLWARWTPVKARKCGERLSDSHCPMQHLSTAPWSKALSSMMCTAKGCCTSVQSCCQRCWVSPRREEISRAKNSWPAPWQAMRWDRVWAFVWAQSTSRKAGTPVQRSGCSPPLPVLQEVWAWIPSAQCTPWASRARKPLASWLRSTAPWSSACTQVALHKVDSMGPCWPRTDSRELKRCWRANTVVFVRPFLGPPTALILLSWWRVWARLGKPWAWRSSFTRVWGPITRR